MLLPVSPRFELRPSRGLQLYLLLVSIFAAFVVTAWGISVNLPMLVRLLLVSVAWIGIAVFFHHKFLLARLRQRDAVCALKYRDGGWELTTVAGKSVICPWRGVRILPWIIALKLDKGDRVFFLVVCRDQLNASQWRRLRVYASAAGLAPA